MQMQNSSMPEGENRTDNARGFLYALGGTLLVSTNYITAKYGLKGFNPEMFSLIWTAAASCYAFAVVVISGKLKELSLPRGSVWGIMTLGVATGAGMILGWSGLSLLDPAFASFIWRFSPVLIILLSVSLLGERLRLIEVLPMVLMVAGGALTTLGRWQIVGTGVVLTLLACAAVAVQMIVVKKIVGSVHPNILVFYRVFLAFLVIGIWTVARGRLTAGVSPPHLLVTMLGAFLGPCASFLLTFRSYRYWPLSRSSILLTAQPLIVLPMAYIAFGKIPSGLELTGGVVILSGALLLVWLHRAQVLQ